MSRRTNYHYETLDDEEDEDINQLRSKVDLLKTVSIRLTMTVLML